ncbi:transformation/transcription domain-associated protein [Parasteatoda tepidariorum]|uniref:transformation/transcription domain-associated protein n=1 Tax=Parasteatoda tepidariorum TaxID=114398 RepID=UPI001C71ABD9|nr:uncharacterized protein LOC107455334 [Parasteatoda tepidariorum]
MQLHSDGEKFDHHLWLKLFNDSTTDAEKQEITQKINCCYEKLISSKSKTNESILGPEKQNFQKILLHFVSIFPFLPGLNNTIEKIANISEDLLQENENEYCEIFVEIITYSFEHLQCIDSDSKKDATMDFITVFKDIFTLDEDMRLLVLNFFMKVFYETYDPNEKYIIDFVSLINQLIKDDIYSKGKTLEISAKTSVTNFVMDLLAFKSRNSESFKSFNDEELKNLTGFFLNKFSTPALNLKLHIEAGQLIKKLVLCQKPDVSQLRVQVEDQLQNPDANKILKQLKSKVDDLKNIVIVLTSRLKLVIEEEIFLIHSSDLRKKGDKPSDSIGNLAGYNEKFIEHPWNNECFSNSYQDYYNLIDVVLTVAQSVINIYMEIVNVFDEKHEYFDFDPKLFQDFLCVTSKALCFFPGCMFFKESPSKKEGFLNLAAVFGKFSPKRLQLILHLSFEVILNCILKNYEFMYFLIELLHEPSNLSTAVIEVLLNYLLEHVEDIGANNHMFNLFLDFLEIIKIVSFKIENRVRSDNKEIFMLHLPDIINKIFEMIQKAEKPHNYIVLLRRLLLKKFDETAKDLCAVKWCEIYIINEIFERMNQYLKFPMKSKYKDELLDICLDVISIRKHYFLHDFKLEPCLCKLYLRIINSSLSASESIILKGLTTLNVLSKKIGINSREVEEMKFEITETLLEILDNSSNNDIRLQTFQLLLKLKTQNLGDIFAFQQKQNVTSADTFADMKNCMKLYVLQDKDSMTELPIYIDKLIISACKVLCESNRTRDRESSWNIIKIFLASTIINSNTHDEIRNCLPSNRYINGGAEREEFHLKNHRKLIYKQKVTEYFLLLLTEDCKRDESETVMIESYKIASFKKHCKKLGIRKIIQPEELMKAVTENFHAGTKKRYSDPVLRNEPIYKSAFCAMFAQVTMETTKNGDQRCQEFFRNVVLHYTLLAILLELNPMLYYGRDVVNPALLIDAFIDYMSCSHQHIEEKSMFGLKFLKTIIISVGWFFSAEQEKTLWSFNYFKTLFDKLCALCYAESPWEKNFGCEALLFLLGSECKKLFFLRFSSVQESAIMKALLYVIESSTKCISEGVTMLAERGLDQAVDYISAASSQDLESVLRLFFDALINPSEAVRSKAYSCLQKIVKKNTVSNLDIYIKGIYDQCFEMLKEYSICPTKVIIGILKGFCLLQSFKKNSLSDYFNTNLNAGFFLKEFLLEQCAKVISKDFKSLQEDEKELFESSLQILCIMSKSLETENVSSVIECIIYALTSANEKMYIFATKCLRILKKYVRETPKADWLKTSITKRIKSVLQSESLKTHDVHVVSCFLFVFQDLRVEEKEHKMLMSGFEKYLRDWFTNSKTVKYTEYVRTLYSIKNSCFWFCNIHPDLFLPLILLIQESDFYIHLKHFDDNLLKHMACYEKHTIKILEDVKEFEKQIYSFFEFVLKSCHEKDIRLCLEKNTVILKKMLNRSSKTLHLSEHQCWALRIISILCKYNKHFIIQQTDLLPELLTIWRDADFKSLNSKADFINLEEYMIIAKCFLSFFSHDLSKPELLNLIPQAGLFNLISEPNFLNLISELELFDHKSKTELLNLLSLNLEGLKPELLSLVSKAKLLHLVSNPRLLSSISKSKLLNYVEPELLSLVSKTELLFMIFRVATGCFLPQLSFFKDLPHLFISKMSTLEQEELLLRIFDRENLDNDVKINILRHLIIPSFSHITELTDEREKTETISFETSKLWDYMKSENTTPDLDLILLQLSSCIMKNNTKASLKNCIRPQNVLEPLQDFSNHHQLNVFNVVRSYGYLLLSLILHSQTSDQKDNTMDTLDQKTIDRVFHNLFDIYQSQWRSITKDALKNSIQICMSSKEGFKILKVTILKALECKVLVKKAFILRTVTQHYEAFYDFKSDIIEEMVNFVDLLSIGNSKKSVLVVDIIDVILAWHKRNVKDKEGNKKPLLDKPSSRVLIKRLLNVYCLDPEEVSHGLMLITGKDLIEKSSTLLKEGFTCNMWSIDCLETYAIFKESLESLGIVETEELQLNLKAQEGRIQILLCSCLGMNNPNILDFMSRTPSTINGKSIIEVFISDCFQSNSIKVVDCIINSILAIRVPNQFSKNFDKSSNFLLYCLRPAVLKMSSWKLCLHLFLESLLRPESSSDKDSESSPVLFFAKMGLLRCLMHLNLSETKISSKTKILSMVLSMMPKVTPETESLVLYGLNVLKEWHIDFMKPEDRDKFFLEKLPTFIGKITRSESFMTIIGLSRFWLTKLETFKYLEHVTRELMLVLDSKFSDNSLLIAHFNDLLIKHQEKYKIETNFVWTVMCESVSEEWYKHQLIRKTSYSPLKKLLQALYDNKNLFQKFSFVKCIELIILSLQDSFLFRNIDRENQENSYKTKDMLAHYNSFLVNLMKIRVSDFVPSLLHLCYIDPSVAEYVWKQIFKTLWQTTLIEDKTELIKELSGFIGEKMKNQTTIAQEKLSISSFLRSTVTCMAPLPFDDFLHQHVSENVQFWCDVLNCLENYFKETLPGDLKTSWKKCFKEFMSLVLKYSPPEDFKSLNKRIFLEALSKWPEKPISLRKISSGPRRKHVNYTALCKIRANDEDFYQSSLKCVEKLPMQLFPDEVCKSLQAINILTQIHLANDVNKIIRRIKQIKSTTLTKTDYSDLNRELVTLRSSTLSKIDEFIKNSVAIHNSSLTIDLCSSFCLGLYQQQQIQTWGNILRKTVYKKKLAIHYVNSYMVQFAEMSKRVGCEQIAWNRIHSTSSIHGLMKLSASIDYYLHKASMSEENLRDYYLNLVCFLTKAKKGKSNILHQKLSTICYSILAKHDPVGNTFASFNFSLPRPSFNFSSHQQYELHKLIGCYFLKRIDDYEHRQEITEKVVHNLLKACTYVDGKKSLHLISMVISVFSFYNFKCMESFFEVVPCSYWLPWIPQLIASLNQHETNNAENVLKIVAKTYPEVVYMPLYVLKESRTCNKTVIELISSMEQSNPKECATLRKFGEGLERLQDKVHGFFLGRSKLKLQELYEGDLSFLKETCQELSKQFERSKEDSLQAEITEILHTFSDHHVDDNQNAKFKTTTIANISTVIRKSIQRVIERQPTQNTLCLCDFLPEYYLQNEGAKLYFDVPLNKGNQASRKISGFLNKVEIVNDEFNFGIRICMKGENGQILPFVLQFCHPDTYMMQTLVYQMYELVNIIFNQESGSMVKLQSPQSLLIGPNLKIVSDYKHSKTLLELCSQAPGKKEFNDFFCEKRLLSLYDEFRSMDYLERKNIKFPTDLLRNWCLTHKDPRSYQLFKRQFSKSLAICNFMNYSFCLDHQNPDLFHIDLNTGHIAIHDLSFQILSDDANDAVEMPFRLTPNISNFIRNEIIGPFKEDMISSARCLYRRDQEILYFLKTLWNNHSLFEISLLENEEISDEETSDEETSDEDTSDEETSDEETSDEETSDEEMEIDVREASRNFEEMDEILDEAANSVLKKIKDLADLQRSGTNAGPNEAIHQLIIYSQRDIRDTASLYNWCRYKFWL